jgi:hypothetical protein
VTLNEADEVMKSLGLELPPDWPVALTGLTDWYISLATRLQERDKALRELTEEWKRQTDTLLDNVAGSGQRRVLDQCAFDVRSLLGQWKEKP